jgi:hypothetical protein
MGDELLSRRALEQRLGTQGHPVDLSMLSLCMDAETLAFRQAGWTYDLLAVLFIYSPFFRRTRTPSAVRLRYTARIAASVLNLRVLTPDEEQSAEAQREAFREEGERLFAPPDEGQP